MVRTNGFTIFTRIRWIRFCTDSFFLNDFSFVCVCKIEMTIEIFNYLVCVVAMTRNTNVNTLNIYHYTMFFVFRVKSLILSTKFGRLKLRYLVYKFYSVFLYLIHPEAFTGLSYEIILDVLTSCMFFCNYTVPYLYQIRDLIRWIFKEIYFLILLRGALENLCFSSECRISSIPYYTTLNGRQWSK